MSKPQTFEIANRLRRKQAEQQAAGVRASYKVRESIRKEERQRQANGYQPSLTESKPTHEGQTTSPTQETRPRGNSERNSVFVSLPQPPPKKFTEIKRPKPTPLPSGKRHAQKAAFAAMAELKRKHRINDDAGWEQLKAQYGNVESRSEWDEETWVIVGARIRCLLQNPHMIQKS